MPVSPGKRIETERIGLPVEFLGDDDPDISVPNDEMSKAGRSEGFAFKMLAFQD